MKKFAILLGVLLCVSCAHAQPPDGPGMGKVEQPGQVQLGNPPQLPNFGLALAVINQLNNPAGKVDLSSPEATVRSFVWALNNRDVAQARLCLRHPLPVELLQNELGLGTQAFFGINDMQSHRDGSHATVTLWLSFTFVNDVSDRVSNERFHLRLVGDKWLLQPQRETTGKTYIFPSEPFSEDVLDFFVAKLSDPKPTRDEAELNQCQVNLKQIGLAFVQYTQDSDEKFPSIENWQEEITPYISDKKFFHCPTVKQDEKSYSYNPDLNNARLADFGAPSQTVLLYEGKDKKFDFRHELDGVRLTNILFADGHVKAFLQETLDAAIKDQMLQWKLAQ